MHSPGTIALFFGCILLLSSILRSQETRGELIHSLSEVGIELPGDLAIPLLPPLLSEDQSADTKLQLLIDLAGKISWERFSKDYVSSPIAIRILPLKDEEQRPIGHNIYSAFIAYASLERLRNRDLMEATFGSAIGEAENESTMMRELTEEELGQLGNESSDSSSEAFTKMELKLLNKIIIRGVVRLETRESEKGFQLYWKLDPVLSSKLQDAKFAASWVSLKPNQVGVLEESAPQPYQGCGGYISVYSTGIATDQLLIESRMILHEPRDWFSGNYSLRSKLPTSLNESAKSFRRRLSGQ